MATPEEKMYHARVADGLPMHLNKAATDTAQKNRPPKQEGRFLYIK